MASSISDQGLQQSPRGASNQVTIVHTKINFGQVLPIKLHLLPGTLPNSHTISGLTLSTVHRGGNMLLCFVDTAFFWTALVTELQLTLSYLAYLLGQCKWLFEASDESSLTQLTESAFGTCKIRYTHPSSFPTKKIDNFTLFNDLLSIWLLKQWIRIEESRGIRSSIQRRLSLHTLSIQSRRPHFCLPSWLNCSSICSYIPSRSHDPLPGQRESYSHENVEHLFRP